MSFRTDVCVVGGCGHVGLPLAITFASKGLRVGIVDNNPEAVRTVQAGRVPFLEPGADSALREVIGKTLSVDTDPARISEARFVVFVIGTPVDEHLNPTFHAILRLFQDVAPRLVSGQCIILRSTVYPGTTERVARLLASSGKEVHIAFCPERVAEGKAMIELQTLPQIVAGCDPRASELASELFGKISKSILYMSPLEAELTKIFANVWRYIQFATANQFFMIATNYGQDFYRIHEALTKDYPRMAGLPKSGFAAGPCLFKDTMQLAAADNNHFSLGHAAMLINEGLPGFIVGHLKQRCRLDQLRVAILGMAFKGDSDDRRDSLSYKLRKILELEAREVLCTDVYIQDPTFVTLADALARADLFIVGAPHRDYREISIPEGKQVVDVWNFFGRGVGL